MFGRWHRWISRLFLGVIAFLAFRGWDGWFVWIVLLMFIGIDHPPTRDIVTPLDGRRRLAAWLTVGAFIVTFMPEPISIAEPSPIFEGERTPVAWHAQPQPVGPMNYAARRRANSASRRTGRLIVRFGPAPLAEHQQPRPLRGIPS
jgi:hypothetical protein